MLREMPDAIRRVIAIDGHDGTGKTSVTHELARRFGGRAVRPFNGSLGDQILWLLTNGEFAKGSWLAQSALRRTYAEHSDEPILWADRHWASILVDLPPAYWHAWLPIPETVFLRASVDTIMERHVERGEDPGETAEHQRYHHQFDSLADCFGIDVIDTDKRSVSATAERVAQTLGLNLRRADDQSKPRVVGPS